MPSIRLRDDRPNHRASRGFSLVELMITVLVVAILTAIAWPSFRDFMHRNAAIAQANQVLASLQYARNEAVSRRYPTGFCGSTAGASCDGGDTLENGWMIWREAVMTRTPPAYVAGTDELLRVTQAQPNVSIRMFPADAKDDLIAFDQTGAVINANGAQSEVVICAKNASGDALGVSSQRAPGKFVRIDASGRITVEDLPADPTGANCKTAP